MALLFRWVVFLPLGLIGVALSTVVLPSLSRQHVKQDHQHYQATLRWAVKIALLLGLPATVGLVLLAGPILVSLFHYGRFAMHDVQMTRLSLVAFTFGLPAFMLIKQFAPKTRAPKC